MTTLHGAGMASLPRVRAIAAPHTLDDCRQRARRALNASVAAAARAAAEGDA